MKCLRLAALVLSVGALPATAQEAQPEPGGGIGDALRGFFNRLLGGGEGPGTGGAEPDKVDPPPSRPQVDSAPSAEPPQTDAAPAGPLLRKSPVFSQALHASIVRGDTLTTLKLIEQGADLEAKDPSAGASPLHYAVMTGRLSIIELLLARGADARSLARNGSAPLHTAVRHHRLEVAEMLIEHGAEVNVKDAGGMTPLGLAEAMRNEPLSAMLRARGAK